MSHLYHLQINVKDPLISFPFYKEFLACIGYSIIDEGNDHIGFSDGITSLWFIATEHKHEGSIYHRKNTGLNHIAFKVDSKERVDDFCGEFLKKKNIDALYNSPKLFPEYHKDYYAVYFEDPDRIKIEVVYTPHKNEHGKNFVTWHKSKVSLQEDKARPFFHEGEVWSCAMGLNIGFEQDGRGEQYLRPVVIVKKFNNEVCWGVPLTTTKKKGKYYFSFTLNDSTSTAILSQIRLIDGKRLQYKMGTVSKEDCAGIRKNLAQLLA